MALTTAQLIAQSQAMIAQTQAQGSAPFAGSSYDTGFGGTPAASSSQQATLQAQIAAIQAQVAPLQQQLSVAQQTGLSGSQQIPEALMANPQQYLADWKVSQTKIPEPDTSTYEGMIAKIKSEIASGEKTSAQIDKELADLQSTYDTSKKKWYDLSSGENQLDIEGKRAELETKYGAQTPEYFAKRTADLAQVEALQKNYNASVAARDLTLSGERERVAPMEFIGKRMDRIERDANIRLNQMSADINTKLGVMEAQRGNFMDAQTLINQAVSDYTAQYKWQYDVTKDYMDINYTQIQNLKAEQRDILSNVTNLALKTYELKLNQTTTIGDLILKYPTAGIKISDSIEEATRKASIVAAQQEIAQTTSGSSSGGTSGGGTTSVKSVFTQTQSNKGAANAGVSFEDFAALDDFTKNIFINGMTEINKVKKSIDEAVAANEDPTAIEKEISDGSDPAPIKDFLVKYLWSITQRPSATSTTTQNTSKWYAPWTWGGTQM